MTGWVGLKFSTRHNPQCLGVWNLITQPNPYILSTQPNLQKKSYRSGRFHGWAGWCPPLHAIPNFYSHFVQNHNSIKLPIGAAKYRWVTMNVGVDRLLVVTNCGDRWLLGFSYFFYPLWEMTVGVGKISDPTRLKKCRVLIGSSCE